MKAVTGLPLVLGHGTGARRSVLRGALAAAAAFAINCTAPPLVIPTDGPCAVTLPNGSGPPGETPDPRGYGNGVLWTWLWPDGTVVFSPGGPGQIHDDGALEMKFPWHRAGQGQLVIRGQRLDAPAPPLRANVPGGYGDTGFQASSLVFPAAGCWEVTGTVGSSSLTFVTRVVKR